MLTRHMDAPFEIKRLEDDGTFAGYGSVFGVVDSYNEIVAKGAFKRSLREWRRKDRMPALLWQHDSTQPIGIYTKMREDDNGLAVEGKLALRTSVGSEAYVLLEMGALNGLSIGFNTRQSEQDQKTGIRTLTDVDLWETSIVTFPANDEARVEQVKACQSNVRDFERLLTQDAGFSRTEARLIINDGWKAMVAKRDAGRQAKAPEAIGDMIARMYRT